MIYTFSVQSSFHKETDGGSLYLHDFAKVSNCPRVPKSLQFQLRIFIAPGKGDQPRPPL